MHDLEFHMISGAPTPVAPFSHAVTGGEWVFVTGQMPTDPDDDAAPLPEGIEAQTHRVMTNLHLVLTGLGLDWSAVAMARAYLTHFDRDYAAMNAVYVFVLPGGCTSGVHVHRRHRPGARPLVEIDLIARTT